MKNPICWICGEEIEDSQDRKGYWASNPHTPECPGNEALLIGHSKCVDTLVKKAKKRVVVVDISGIEKAREAELSSVNIAQAREGLRGN